MSLFIVRRTISVSVAAAAIIGIVIGRVIASTQSESWKPFKFHAG